MVQVQIARFAEFFEQEMRRYPRERNQQFERRAQIERERRIRLEEENERLKMRIKDLTELNQEVTKVYQMTQKMAQDIQTQLMPSTRTIMSLKQHMATLY